MANWELIKKEYVSGIPPRELAKKHKVKSCSISVRASEEKWKEEKLTKTKEIADNFEKQIEKTTSLAIVRLVELLEKQEIRDNDLINAIGKAFDVSGLKKEKTESNVNLKTGLTIQVGNLPKKEPKQIEASDVKKLD